MLDSRQFTLYLKRAEIEEAVVKLAEKINRDYEGEKVVLVGVLKGAFIFVADLMRHLKIHTEVDFVRLVNKGKSKDSAGTICFQKDISVDLKDKHVLIIEQIIDSGRTLHFLYERLQKSPAKSVEVVTLLDKAEKRMVETPVKYVGIESQDQFLVGYGLDLEEENRNLADLYYLKYPN